MRVTAGGEDEPGILYLSYSAIILGSPSVKPYSPCDRATGALFPAAISKVSLSMSQLRQTATFAPLGQLLGVSFRPARMGATHCWICSSVSLVPGCGLFSCCACNNMGSKLNIRATSLFITDFRLMILSCFGYSSQINSKVAHGGNCTGNPVEGGGTVPDQKDYRKLWVHLSTSSPSMNRPVPRDQGRHSNQ